MVQGKLSIATNITYWVTKGKGILHQINESTILTL